jgi:hypothetical protein
MKRGRIGGGGSAGSTQLLRSDSELGSALYTNNIVLLRGSTVLIPCRNGNVLQQVSRHQVQSVQTVF